MLVCADRLSTCRSDALAAAPGPLVTAHRRSRFLLRAPTGQVALTGITGRLLELSIARTRSPSCRRPQAFHQACTSEPSAQGCGRVPIPLDESASTFRATLLASAVTAKHAESKPHERTDKRGDEREQPDRPREFPE